MLELSKTISYENLKTFGVYEYLIQTTDSETIAARNVAEIILQEGRYFRQIQINPALQTFYKC